MFAVLLQRVHNGRLEVVDGDKVREEGQDVLNLNTRIKIISWLSPTQSNVIRQGRTQEGRGGVWGEWTHPGGEGGGGSGGSGRTKKEGRGHPQEEGRGQTQEKVRGQTQEKVRGHTQEEVRGHTQGVRSGEGTHARETRKCTQGEGSVAPSEGTRCTQEGCWRPQLKISF